jgi:RND family efflux transporter MFP subunit
MISMAISRKVLGTILIVSFITGGCGKGIPKATGEKAIPVKLQTLESNTLIDSSEFVGTLVAQQNVNLAPKIDGRIAKIFVNYGASVKRGDPIILLEPTQQKEEVNAAVGNVNVQKATLDKTVADLRTIEAQGDAAKAEVANREANVANSVANLANAQETLKTKEADLKSSQAELELAQIEYKRYKFLVDNDVVKLQDLDDRTRTLKTSQQTVQANLKTVEAAKATVQANQASVNAAKAAFKQAKDNLRAAQQRVAAASADINRQKAAISQAEGQLGSVNQDLAFNKVVAPIDGIVGTIPNKVGDILAKGESFTIIANNSVLEMNINIPIGDSSQLRAGLPVEILNQDGKAGVAGNISFISPTVNQNAQAILAKVIFRNDGSLRNNQYVRVRVIWDKKPGLLIPTSAISNVGAQKFIFVAEKEAKGDKLVVRQKPIEVGTIQGQSYQVVSGVDAGQKIAVSRILDLRDGVSITEEPLLQKKTLEQ